jgi:hypothetical protein
MVLENTDKGWRAIRKMPSVSLIHPVMSRLRDDKQVNNVDVRMAQLDDRCFIAESYAQVEKPDRSPSEIVRREVYTKTTKQALAVRKLLVWKTNKDEDDPSFPAFVVHWSDYSPGRKTPLQREVRLAPAKDRAMAIADAMIAANIKKGWEPAEANPRPDTPSTASDDDSTTDQEPQASKKKPARKKTPAGAKKKVADKKVTAGKSDPEKKATKKKATKKKATKKKATKKKATKKKAPAKKTKKS